MVGTYNGYLVFLSAVVATLAGYATLEASSQVARREDSDKTFWLVQGAFTMGTGIWAMHFIAMLAFSIPLTVSYNFIIVAVSLLAAIVGAGIALFIVSRPKINVQGLLGGSAMMGTAIACMHYTGMWAMNVDAKIHYNPLLFMLSVVIAIAVSLTALVLSMHFRDRFVGRVHWTKMLTSVLMGGGVVSMHYTGMAAATFTRHPISMSSVQVGLDETNLAFLVGIFTLYLLIFSIVLLNREAV